MLRAEGAWDRVKAWADTSDKSNVTRMADFRRKANVEPMRLAA